MSTERKIPRVSIGLPVFNGEVHLKNALDALLNQTFSDFELIISDNASSDKTKEICEQYAKHDARIRYIRQAGNIGATKNFKFVLDQAVGEYFMWAAADDIRSPDFLELNYNFLSENSEYVASTSPNRFEGRSDDKRNFIKFSLDDDEKLQRIIKFFDYGWVSHGIFYSLVRTSVLRDCEIIGLSFIGADWAVNTYLASKGKINRTSDGYTIFGANGISSSSNAYKDFRNNFIELLLPFYQLSKYVICISTCFNIRDRIKILFILVKLNIKADLNKIWAQLYPIYFRYIRPIVRNKYPVK